MLIAMRCIDEPPPPGTYLIDGCTSHPDPWREGSAPYFLAIIIAFIVSAIGLLRPIRPARLVFVVALAALWSIRFALAVVAVKEHMDWMKAEPRSWVAAWDEASGYFAFRHHYLFWLVQGAWMLIDGWFPYASRARNFFRTPPAPARDT